MQFVTVFCICFYFLPCLMQCWCFYQLTVTTRRHQWASGRGGVRRGLWDGWGRKVVDGVWVRQERLGCGVTFDSKDRKQLNYKEGGTDCGAAGLKDWPCEDHGRSKKRILLANRISVTSRAMRQRGGAIAGEDDSLMTGTGARQKKQRCGLSVGIDARREHRASATVRGAGGRNGKGTYHRCAWQVLPPRQAGCWVLPPVDAWKKGHCVSPFGNTGTREPHVVQVAAPACQRNEI